MIAKFCLPILVKTKKEVLKKITENKNQYDMFEVWISSLKEPFPVILDLIQNLSKELQGKLIIVFRDRNGKVIMEKDKKENILSLCNNSKVLVDIDFENQKEDLQFININKLKIKILLSYHNFEETPHNLIEIIDRMEKIKPEIIKLATKCNSNTDSIKLLGLLLFCKKRGLKCIVLGMGKFGVITRIFGSLWGNEIVFAPVEKRQASASGQLTVGQLKDIFAILK